MEVDENDEQVLVGEANGDHVLNLSVNLVVDGKFFL